MTNSEIIPLPLHLPPDQWAVVMTRCMDPATLERTFHYELKLNAVCLCEWSVVVSLAVLAHADAGEWVEALHKEAIRVLMRALAPAIANQIQMVRQEGWKAVVEQHDA